MKKKSSARLETLEPRQLLTAVVQQFSQVDYFGDSDDWALNAVNAPEAWEQGFTGNGVIVAVVDSGIDFDHADLVDQIWSNPGEIAGNGIDDDANGFVDDAKGWDFVTDDANPHDEAGHGTRVAGIVGANRDDVGATGVAYDAQIMPIRVLDAQGKGSQFDIASGIRYAVDNGAHIINVSLGSATGSLRVRRAIQHALAEEVLIVSASGNAGNATPDFPAAFSSEYENVISVGAFNSSRDIASFSNGVGDSGAIQVDAPGVAVYSTNIGGGTRSNSGTSYATPLVSGVAALMLSANPSMTAADIRTALVDNADFAIDGSDAEGGINAAAAVAAGILPSLPPLLIPGDTDGDGLVGLSDFLIVSSNYGKQVPSQTSGDFDGDGLVEFSDFLILTRNFGQSASAASTAVDQAFSEPMDFASESPLDELI